MFTKEQQESMLHRAARSSNMDGHIVATPPATMAELQSPFAMLLKAQYWHAAKRMALFEEIPPSYILPLTWRPDFFFKEREKGSGGSPLMDVMWCVWLTPWMKNVQTVYKPLPRPLQEVQKGK